MDINHIHINHHTPTITTKFPLSNNINWEKGLDIISMDDHQHHHHHQYNDQHVHHPLMPLFAPVWPTYHNLPAPYPSPTSMPPPTSSSYIIKPTLQEQVLEEDEHELEEEEEEELGAMKEMMYRIAVMQPVDIDPATIRKPKRRNVRISNDPQSVAARHRRERISEKIRILQRLVPGGVKMDTASMLDEAIRYVKFLKRQIRQLQSGSSDQQPPAVPNLWPSDWPAPPPSASVVGHTSNPGHSKVMHLRDNQNHHNEGMIFHHGGNQFNCETN